MNKNAGKDIHICLIGNLNIDLIIRNVPALPQWGQEVIGSSHIEVSSGQAAYTAFALSRFGSSVSIVGKVGEDLQGQKILAELESAGVDIRGSEITPGGSTGITVAIVREDGERAFVSDPACLRSFDEQLVNRHWDRVEQANVVCMVGIFFMPGFTLAQATNVMRRAKSENKLTVLDTGWDPFGWQEDTLAGLHSLLQQVDIFIPNMDEARAITGESDPEASARLLQSYGPATVLIKRGAEGCLALHNDELFSIPAIPVKVYDAVGAGDVFNAGFLYAHGQGWPFEKCLAFATSTSALYISKPVDRFPTLEEVTGSVQNSYRA